MFVTNFAPSISREPDLQTLANRANGLYSGSNSISDSLLTPPTPKYAHRKDGDPSRSKSRSSSVDSSDSGWSSDDSLADLSYSQGNDTRRGRRSPSQDAGGNRPHRHRIDQDTGYQGVYDDSDEEDVGTARHLVVELTNFDGEEDERDAGESNFSARVKNQGKHVRRRTMAQRDLAQHRSSRQTPLNTVPSRHPQSHGHSESVTEDIVFSSRPPDLANPTRSEPVKPVPPRGTASPRPPQLINAERDHQTLLESTVPLAREPRIQALRINTQPAVHSPLSPQYQPRSLSPSISSHPAPPNAQIYPPRPHSRTQNHQRRASARLSIAESLYTQSDGDSTSPTSTMHRHFQGDTSSVHELTASSSSGREKGGPLDYLGNLSHQERDDLGHLAAMARHGRPKIDKILASEVERASGRLIVACEFRLNSDFSVPNLIFPCA